MMINLISEHKSNQTIEHQLSVVDKPQRGNAACVILRNERSTKKKSTVMNDRAHFSVGTMHSHR